MDLCAAELTNWVANLVKSGLSKNFFLLFLYVKYYLLKIPKLVMAV